MSRGSQEKREKLFGELAQELRQLNGLGASFFRAAASRTGMTVTDLQVIDILGSGGPATAGQLAELTGLTTGAITGMLNRLEETGLVSRERDPNDGRKVIVQLVGGKNEMSEINSIFATVGKEWGEMAASYDDEQLVFLLEFLKRSNTVSRREIGRLREAPGDKQGSFSAMLGEFSSGRLHVTASGISFLTLRADASMTELYQARFKGPVPDVKVKDGAVTIRYPKRLLVLGGEQRTAEVKLSAAIPWDIVIQGGAAMVDATLSGLNLAGLEVKGGLNMILLDLPRPTSVVPVRISGGAAQITVRRPAGVATRAHLKGWVSEFVFDDQRFSSVGNDVRLQSPDYDTATASFDIEVASSASMVTISSV